MDPGDAFLVDEKRPCRQAEKKDKGDKMRTKACCAKEESSREHRRHDHIALRTCMHPNEESEHHDDKGRAGPMRHEHCGDDCAKREENDTSKFKMAHNAPELLMRKHRKRATGKQARCSKQDADGNKDIHVIEEIWNKAIRIFRSSNGFKRRITL